MALSYLGDELNLQIRKFVLELCFDCWNFFKGMLKCKWMFIIFSTCLLKQWKSFLFLILDLKYVALTFKVDPLLLQCWKKWHGASSPALWAERWHLLQWLLKVVWQCQLPRRCIWADLSCLWCPHISFPSPLPFVIRCPKSVIYNMLFQFCSDIFATNK